MLFKSRFKKKKLEDTEPKKGNDEFDLESDLFGEEFDFDKVTVGGKVRNFGKGFSSTILNKQSRKNLIRGTLTGLLPDEYNHIISATEGAWDAVRRNVERAQEDNASELLSLTSKTENNLHKLKGRLPTSSYSRIEKKLAEKRTFFASQVKENQRKRSNSVGGAKKSESEMLAEAMADTFAVAEASRAHGEQESSLRDSVKESLRSREESVRFNASLEVLQGIREDVNRQTSFQDTFVMRYQRKMLEVSYRSYFALRDIRRLTGVGLDFNRMSSESIIHNTSLPDSQKASHAISRIDSGQVDGAIRDTGAAQRGFSYTDQFKRQAANEAYKKYRGTLADYQAEFWPKIQKSIQQNVQDTLMGLDMSTTMMGGMNLNDMPPEMMGEEGGRAASSLMGRFVMPRLAQRFRPQMEKVSRRLDGRNFLASYMLKNAPSVLQDFAYDQSKDDSSLIGILRGMARAHVPEYRLDGELPGASYKALDKPVSFNNMSQRSLVEIIPGYLSRILHIQKKIWTGDDSIGRDVYDITKGAWVTDDSAKASMRSRIVTERERENIRTTLNEVVTKYKGDEDLSDEAQYAFRDQLMRDAALGNRFDPEKYIKGEFGEDTPEETRDELIRFMRRRFKFDEDDRLVREYDNLRQLDAFSDEFMRIRDVVPSSKEEIERIHGLGSQELMRDMGIIYTQHGQDYINYNKLWSMYRGDDTLDGQGPTPGPFSPGGPRTEEGEEEKVPETPSDMFKSFVKRKGEGFSGAGFKPQWEKEGYSPLNDLGDTPDSMKAAQGKRRDKRSAVDRLKDIYSKVGRKLLLRRDILNNMYMDVKSGKVVESIDDITGPVEDKEGNLAITQEDFDRGLFDVEGNVQKPSAFNASSLGRSPSDAFEGSKLHEHAERVKAAQERLRKAKNTVTGSDTFKSIKDRVEGSLRDAYLPGEEKPRLTVKDLKEGKYTDRKGNILKHFDDINGDTVFDIDMNVVVVPEEIDRLVDIFGEPHKIARNQTIRGNIGRLARRGVRGYVNWSKDYYKKLPGRLLRGAKMAGRIAKSPFNLMNRLFGGSSGKEKDPDKEGPLFGVGRRLRGRYDDYYKGGERGKEEWDRFDREEAKTAGGTQENLDPEKRGFKGRNFRWMKDPRRDVNGSVLETPTDALLYRINDNLEEQNEEHRKGSWQDILSKKKGETTEKKEERVEKESSDKESGIFAGLKGILGAIGGLFGLGAAGSGAGSLLGGLGSLLGGGKGDKPGGGGKRGWMKRTWDGLLGRDGGTRTGKLIRYAGIGASWIGRAALAVAASPVALTALGVSMVGYGGYKLWERYKETAGRLYAIRFRQYGIEPKTREQAIPVLELEAALETATKRDSEGKVDIDLNSIDFEEILGGFGLSGENEEHLNSFIEWFQGRFMPVYTKHQSSLGKMGVDYKLTKLDDDMTVDHALEYIALIRNVKGDALGVMASPFGPDKPLTSSNLAIEEAIEEALEYYNREDRRQGTPEQRKAMARWGLIDPTPEMEEEYRKDNAPEVKLGTLDAHMGDLGGKATAHSRVARKARAEALSFLQKLRGYAYGLSHFDEDDFMDGLLSMEDAALEDIKFKSNGQAEFSGSADRLLSDNAEKLGIVWSVRSPETRLWRNWFNDRFITVLLAYAAKAREVDRAVRLNGSGKQMSKSNQLKVARAIVAAKKDGWFSDKSIWDINSGNFTGHDPNQSLLLAEELIREFANKERSQSVNKNPVPKPGDNEDQSSNPQWRDKDGNPLLPDGAKMNFRAGAYYQGVLPGSGGGGFGTSGVQTPMSPGGPMQPQGAVYGDLLSGTGGAFEEIEYPNQNKSREAAMPTLRDVEKMTGVSADLLATFAKIESNFDYNVKAPTSSATGWFQFIDKTWDAVIKKYGGKYGIPTDLPEAERRALRKDPRINALMGAELLKENYQALESKTGRTPTDADLYLAHFMGASRAGNVLSAPDMNVIAANAYPDAAKANESVFYKDGRALTVGEIVQWADSKVAPGRKGDGAQMVNSHHTPDQAITPEGGGKGGSPEVDLSGVNALTGGSNSAPASRGPSDVSLYGSGKSDGSGDIGDERYEKAYGSATNASDPYGPRGNVPSPGSLPTGNSGEFTEIETQRARRFNEVRETERRQRDRLEEGREETHALGSIAERQLEEQVKMSGYLKTIAESLGVKQTQEESKPSNDTSRTPESSSSSRSPNQARTGPTMYSEREAAGVSMKRD